jgi:hypothetical protein
MPDASATEIIVPILGAIAVIALLVGAFAGRSRKNEKIRSESESKTDYRRLDAEIPARRTSAESNQSSFRSPTKSSRASVSSTPSRSSGSSSRRSSDDGSYGGYVHSSFDSGCSSSSSSSDSGCSSSDSGGSCGGGD